MPAHALTRHHQWITSYLAQLLTLLRQHAQRILRGWVYHWALHPSSSKADHTDSPCDCCGRSEYIRRSTALGVECSGRLRKPHSRSIECMERFDRAVIRTWRLPSPPAPTTTRAHARSKADPTTLHSCSCSHLMKAIFLLKTYCQLSAHHISPILHSPGRFVLQSEPVEPGRFFLEFNLI